MLSRKYLNAGMSLLELLVGLGIATTLGLAAMMWAKNSMVIASQPMPLTARSMIESKIRTSIVRKSFLGPSEARNKDLKRCMTQGLSNCEANSPNKQLSFRLYTKKGAQDVAIAGSESQPVFYSGDGLECPEGVDPLSSDCNAFWKVIAYYWASCGPLNNTCEGARLLYVRFKIEPYSERDWNQRQKPVPWPDALSFEREKSSYALGVRLKEERDLMSCLPFSSASGINSKGELICVCNEGAVATGTNALGQPKCELDPNKSDANCLGRVLLGYDSQRKAICGEKYYEVAAAGCIQIPSSAKCNGTERWFLAEADLGSTVRCNYRFDLVRDASLVDGYRVSGFNQVCSQANALWCCRYE